jgi:hypothetical protein
MNRLLFILLLISSDIAQAQMTNNNADYLRGFDERCKYETVVYDTAANPGIYGAAVRYAQNRELEKADSLFLNCDNIKNPKGDMFWMFPVIGTYLHGKDRMSQKVKDAVRNVWKTYAPYRGDTENHWCLYYSSLFLAAESWPGLPGSEWFNGRSSDENLKEAKEYLIHWIKITTTIGQGEFDAPSYLPEYVIPMTLLADFAQDSSMRKRGEMMLDYLLADFAVSHLDGMYIGGFSREGATTVWNPRTAPASHFAYLYFGTGPAIQSGWLVFSVLSKYRLPDIIYRIATDRSRPFLCRKTKRVRNVIRYGTEKNPPVYKQTYITKDYGLGSLQGGILQPIQQSTWSVRFTACAPTSTIFGLHPYWSGTELAMFFPEEKKILIDDVSRSKGTYNQDTKWTGSSPYERTFQYNNTLIVLYDIPAGTTSEHIDGFFPKNLDKREVDSSGWIFCKAGDTYVGWFPLQPYEWLCLKEDDYNFRLRSNYRQNGYVVEVRSKNEVGSYEEFCAKLRTTIPRAQMKEGSVRVDYQVTSRLRMSFGFPEERKLNGKQFDFSTFILTRSNFINAQSEMLSLCTSNPQNDAEFEIALFDFKRLTVTHQLRPKNTIINDGGNIGTVPKE